MELEYLISLGKRLSGYLEGRLRWRELDEAVALSQAENPYFTEYMQRRALRAICENFLEEKVLRQWVNSAACSSRERKALITADANPLGECRRPKSFPYRESCTQLPSLQTRIGVVMAGNIPMVGFHDLLCVLISGGEPVVKLSSKDKYLLPVLFPDVHYVSAEGLSSQKLDALITMGGAKAAAYYSGVFPDIPKLIRSSRFSAAVLSGRESEAELDALCEDISLYYGLGCRSVTHLFIKYNFDIQDFSKRLNSYCNNIVTDFSHTFFVKNRAIMTIENTRFIAAEPFVLQETKEFFLPVGVIGYSCYESEDEISSLEKNRADIQKIYRNFGFAQRPSLDDYPDGADTLTFCLSINR